MKAFFDWCDTDVGAAVFGALLVVVLGISVWGVWCERRHERGER